MSKIVKQTLFGPINEKPKIGDEYVDRPTYEAVPVYCGREPLTGRVVRYYKRTAIRWMKPGPDGKLVPR